MPLGVLAAGAALLPAAVAQAPIVSGFGRVVAPESPNGQAALRFEPLADEGSKGRVKVEVYPNSQLYKDKEELAALQPGAMLFEVFDRSHIFQTEEQFVQVTGAKIGQEWMATRPHKGFTGLAFCGRGRSAAPKTACRTTRRRNATRSRSTPC